MSGNAEPVYDRSLALAQLDGDESLFAAIAAVFVAECAGYCAALEAALAAGDPVALRREAHTTKSMLASFAFEPGRALALRLEEVAATGRLDGAAELTAELGDAMWRLAAALRSELD